MLCVVPYCLHESNVTLIYVSFLLPTKFTPPPQTTKRPAWQARGRGAVHCQFIRCLSEPISGVSGQLVRCERVLSERPAVFQARVCATDFRASALRLVMTSAFSSMRLVSFNLCQLPNKSGRFKNLFPSRKGRPNPWPAGGSVLHKRHAQAGSLRRTRPAS